MKGAEYGITLIEFAVAIAIMAFVLGVAIVSLNTVTSSNMRSASTQVSSAIRYLYNLSALTSRYCRFGVRLQENRYTAECSDTPFYLKKNKLDVVANEVKSDDEVEEEKVSLPSGQSGLFAELSQQLMKEQTANFTTLRSRFLRSTVLPGNVYFDSMIVSHLNGRVFKGSEYIYFFPGGQTENAFIYLSDEKQNIYTVRVYALSGKVEVYNSFIEPEEEREE